MARIRTIKPDFFRHAELYDAEKASKLPLRVAYAGLWTAADREGRFKWDARALKLDCLPFDDVDFCKVLEALWRNGFVIKYVVDGKEYGFIPSWKDHQHVNLREAESKLPEPTEECTCTHVTAHGEGKGREGEGKGTDISTREDASRDALFDRFKKEYPKRGASNPWQPTRQLFFQAIKNGHDPEMMIRGARGYREECDRNKITGTDKVAQAQTFIRQARFLDYQQQDEAPAGPVTPNEFAIKLFKQMGRWNLLYGPEPGKPGCRASPEDLAKYGYQSEAAA